MPEVSVIIPTYNSVHYLPKAIDSVLNQSFRDFELIVVDDGSTDITREIVKKYEGIARYFYQENQGVSVARNNGIEKSLGRYIAFLDDDDYWHKDKLIKQVNFLKKNSDIAMVYTDMHSIDPFERIIDRWLETKSFYRSKNVYASLIKECFIIPSSVLIRRECFEKIGLFDPKYRNAQDLDLWLRIARSFKIAVIEEPLTFRRLHGKNMSINIENSLLNRISIFKDELEIKYLKLSDCLTIWSVLSSVYFDLGYLYFERGSIDSSRSNFMKSLKFNFLKLHSLLYLVSTFLPATLIRLIRELKKRFSKDYRYA